MRRRARPNSIIGWRELVSLPDMSLENVRAKVDTGAQSSALHAWRIQEFKRDGEDWVRFLTNPTRRRSSRVEAEGPLVAKRYVKNSGGQRELRPVISTRIDLMGRRFLIELTLTRREAMSFPMLLGRQAVRGRFLVDTGRSYIGLTTLDGIPVNG